ncbi:hypothetical protein BHU72_10020 [Desulfuribacillus stibiiarsenatis]|uniref:Uncharacterized protein n=1 Tax=Desulfuribacillus stibiiarsenatis TaxID=1390249 RepID=A0A1E5L956_9FIRM|nr:hypothetical protein [Desulfuribacillus stibiiarsenatis]OEH86588.1 hypothetical protein BHU72_10020 [Desulfuribacillus stibiiarsenatis]
MHVTWNGPNNIIEVVFSILSWSFIIYLIYYYYQKQEVKPKLWKAYVATFVGIITFDLNYANLQTMIKIPILPLGVWILYGYASSRKGAWNRYRRFAWLGFFANFIFIAMTIIAVFLNSVVYPKGNLSTYISQYDEAVIIPIHPTAENVTFDKERFEQFLPLFEEEQLMSIDWYTQTVINVEPDKRIEKYPYSLSGTSSKWGSGLFTLIYVERDGKGILIDSKDKQRYFRSNESFLKGGDKE